MTYSSEIISVFTGNLNQESTSEEDNTVLLCDARELHRFLQVGRDFSSWIKKRIEDYGFIENQDYILIWQKNLPWLNATNKDALPDATLSSAQKSLKAHRLSRLYIAP